MAPSVEPAVPPARSARVDTVWAGLVLATIFVVFVLLLTTRNFGVPLFLALFGAYVLGPVVNRMVRRGLSRTAAVAVLFACGFAGTAGFLLYLVPTLVRELEKVPGFLTKAIVWFDAGPARHLGLHVSPQLSKLTAQLAQQLSEMDQDVVPVLLHALGSTGRVVVTLLGLLVAPVIAFHFLRDAPRYREAAVELLPPHAREQVRSRFAEIDRVLSAFVRGQLTVGAILAAIYGAGLSLAGVDMALGIALIAGFGNLVPYMGAGCGMALTAVSLIVSGPAPWQVGVAVGTFVLGQLLESLLLTPRIVGERVGLPAVAVILAVLGFGELFGFVGVLLAVPTTAALTVVGRVLLEQYRRSRLYAGN